MYESLQSCLINLSVDQSHHPPTAEGGFQVFLGVCGKSPRAGMTAPHPNPSFDFDQGSSRKMGEIRPPFPHKVKPEFAF